jgi:hypothetical protein
VNRIDSFDRADSTSTLDPPSDGGSGYATFGTTWGVTSSRAYDVSAAGGVAHLEASSANCEVGATLQDMTGARAGVVGRLVDSGNYWHAEALADASLARLWRRQASSDNLEASPSVAWASGDVIKLRMDGDDITVYKNDTSVITFSSSFNNTATKWGIRSSATGSPRWDDLYVTDLDAAAGGGAARLVNGGLVNAGLVNGGLVR